MSKLSIVIPVYYNEDTLMDLYNDMKDKILDRIGDYEIVMVDDGSTDSSGAICDKYKELYPDNIVVVHTKNGGLSSARNVGLRYVEGKYVNFFDPDDILTPSSLSEVYSFFIAKLLECCYHKLCSLYSF